MEGESDTQDSKRFDSRLEMGGSHGPVAPRGPLHHPMGRPGHQPTRARGGRQYIDVCRCQRFEAVDPDLWTGLEQSRPALSAWRAGQRDESF